MEATYYKYMQVVEMNMSECAINIGIYCHIFQKIDIKLCFHIFELNNTMSNNVYYNLKFLSKCFKTPLL